MARPVRNPRHRRRKGASVGAGAIRPEGGACMVSGRAFLAMFRGAIGLATEHEGFSARNMGAAVSTGDDIKRATGGLAPRPGLRLRRCLFAAPTAAPHTDGHHQNDQKDDVFHALRPNTTSRTKREPT